MTRDKAFVGQSKFVGQRSKLSSISGRILVKQRAQTAGHLMSKGAKSHDLGDVGLAQLPGESENGGG